MRTPHAFIQWTLFMSCAALGIAGGCTSEDNALAPYSAGGRELSSLTIQDSVFRPKVSWLGGYVSAFGVNRGAQARLDTSLVWLIYQGGNNVHYPVTYGQLPSGAQDLTTHYGGTPLPSLLEDHEYTFWVLKDDAWAQVSANPGKPIVVDSSATQTVQLRNDTLLVSMQSLVSRTRNTDVYINVRDVNIFGRLVIDPVTFKPNMTVVASDTCNRPVISWTVVQAGVTDQLVAAMGVCGGGEYSVDTRAWEMISKDVQPDTTIFWKNNVIASPIAMGTSVQGTETFIEYPVEGLQRGQTYYFWMAAKDWDGKSRTRVAKFYAYATFAVW